VITDKFFLIHPVTLFESWNLGSMLWSQFWYLCMCCRLFKAYGRYKNWIYNFFQVERGFKAVTTWPINATVICSWLDTSSTAVRRRVGGGGVARSNFCRFVGVTDDKHRNLIFQSKSNKEVKSGQGKYEHPTSYNKK
jgi:hypothetical protein